VLGTPDDARVDGAVLAERAFALRFESARGDERLLLVNLGEALHLAVMPEPLLAPPDDRSWALRWSSEDPLYGGLGLPELPASMEAWSLPGGCAVLFAPVADPSGHIGLQTRGADT
jgi:maltooligosyltrehalose trehalohydrolase